MMSKEMTVPEAATAIYEDLIRKVIIHEIRKAVIRERKRCANIVLSHLEHSSEGSFCIERMLREIGT